MILLRGEGGGGGCTYLVSLICVVRMDFSEQYHIRGEVLCNEPSILSKTH